MSVEERDRWIKAAQDQAIADLLDEPDTIFCLSFVDTAIADTIQNIFERSADDETDCNLRKPRFRRAPCEDADEEERQERDADEPHHDPTAGCVTGGAGMAGNFATTASTSA